MKTIQSCKLTSNASIAISNQNDSAATIEIGVPLKGTDLIDLGYPRLYGTSKIKNGSWSVILLTSFLLRTNLANSFLKPKPKNLNAHNIRLKTQ